jgi:hypothetical protein
MRAGLKANLIAAAAPGPSATVAAESPRRFMGPEAAARLAPTQAARDRGGGAFCRGPHCDRVPPRITGAFCARRTSVEFHSSMDEVRDYLAKAQEGLAGERTSLVHHRLNNSALNAYYACFQVAIAALLNKEIFPRTRKTFGGMQLFMRDLSAD